MSQVDSPQVEDATVPAGTPSAPADRSAELGTDAGSGAATNLASGGDRGFDGDRPSGGSTVADLMDRWEEARDGGRPLSPEELCRDCPEHLAELRQQVRALGEFEKWVGQSPTSSAAPAKPARRVRADAEIGDLTFYRGGGLGAVYTGTDEATGRTVAVKFLHPRLAEDEAVRRRFGLEAEVTARLEHPGIVPLYGIGRADGGAPFYVMRYVQGRTMAAAIADLYREEREGAIPRVEHDRRYRRLLTEFVSVCRTIAYAHTRGIVHRDLKPANVMVGRYGETLVVDWGMAAPVARAGRFRVDHEETLMPDSGDRGADSRVGGTPSYMGPEQAAGLPPTPAEDLYSLGATLFAILTGRAPVTGGSTVEVLRRVIEGRLDDPLALRPTAPPALCSVAGRALAARSGDRYATALELADDVEAYLNDDRVSAHPESRTARLLRLGRRHRGVTRTVLGGLCAAAAAGTVGAIVLGAYAARETQLRGDAERSAAVAATAERQARRSRDETLTLSAGYLAGAVAANIDVRWRILEAEMAKPEPRRLTAALNAKLADAPRRDDGSVDLAALEPERTELQRFLNAAFERHRDVVEFDSLSVFARDGTQIARSPGARSVGRNFRHRDYFHGRGRDLTDAEVDADPPAPLPDRPAHMCDVYRSTSDASRTLKTGFSVPIFGEGDAAPGAGDAGEGDAGPIGVALMSVPLGAFRTDRHTWLVDTRPNGLVGERGLLLQHPRYGRPGDDLPRVDDETVARMLALRTAAADRRPPPRDAPAAGAGSADGPADPRAPLTLTDPIGGTPRRAAMAPVVVPGRPDELADTGWVVVVAE